MQQPNYRVDQLHFLVSGEWQRWSPWPGDAAVTHILHSLAMEGRCSLHDVTAVVNEQCDGWVMNGRQDALG